MTEDISRFAMEYMAQDNGNIIQSSYAIAPELVGTAMYERPIMGIASAADPYFDTCKKPM